MLNPSGFVKTTKKPKKTPSKKKFVTKEVQNYAIQQQSQRKPPGRSQGGARPKQQPRSSGGTRGGSNGTSGKPGPRESRPSYVPTFHELKACCFCNSNKHHSKNCNNRGQVTTWWDKVYKNKACPMCFKTFHLPNDCKQKQPCSKSGCTMNHHTLMHDAPYKPFGTWKKEEMARQQRRQSQPQ